ncbi:hypothetical protein NDU88_003330 [Pleurodeles waltl]|uniref:Uncharacterized protein n=1 Tax=Pleurodeles waltl TaxID=8319 RepID=A0AAV7VG99_PLEWA|nr:hypothetical protein NDU88_003330 [Pleurodeles waltl]
MLKGGRRHPTTTPTSRAVRGWRKGPPRAPRPLTWAAVPTTARGRKNGPPWALRPQHGPRLPLRPARRRCGPPQRNSKLHKINSGAFCVS